MRSIRDAHQHSGISEKLIRAVIRQLGSDKDELEGTLTDIMNHGVNGGFSGFTYYTDTCKFYQRNKKDILAHLKQQADDFGQGVIGMVKSFKCAKDEDAVGRVLYGKAGKDDQGVENCLAWYAAEEVARAMVDE